jgi:hypothetical protein
MIKTIETKIGVAWQSNVGWTIDGLIVDRASHLKLKSGVCYVYDVRQIVPRNGNKPFLCAHPIQESDVQVARVSDNAGGVNKIRAYILEKAHEIYNQYQGYGSGLTPEDIIESLTNVSIEQYAADIGLSSLDEAAIISYCYKKIRRISKVYPDSNYKISFQSYNAITEIDKLFISLFVAELMHGTALTELLYDDVHEFEGYVLTNDLVMTLFELIQLQNNNN